MTKILVEIAVAENDGVKRYNPENDYTDLEIAMHELSEKAVLVAVGVAMPLTDPTSDRPRHCLDQEKHSHACGWLAKVYTWLADPFDKIEDDVDPQTAYGWGCNFAKIYQAEADEILRS